MYNDRGKLSFTVISYTIIISFCIMCLMPFYLVVVASFTAESVILTQGFGLYVTPESFSLEGYRMVWESPSTILRAYGVTIFVTVVGTAGALFVTLMTAYVLARSDFPWKNKLSFFFYFTTLFSGGLVPWYLLCVNVLGFTNSIHALILPPMFSVWNLIISKNFMKSIPREIIESGTIDGAGDFKIFYALVAPVCTPLVATIGLFTALFYWNDWYHSMLFARSEDLHSLQYFLQRIFNSAEALRRIAQLSGREVRQMPMESMKMAMLVVATGPIVFLYPFLQKYFVKGLTVGAVKG